MFKQHFFRHEQKAYIRQRPHLTFPTLEEREPMIVSVLRVTFLLRIYINENSNNINSSNRNMVVVTFVVIIKIL